ncbi:MAG: hypothetical protein K0R05_1486 [Anaerocolumna sp.]|jgi:beta-lactamase regulating signal transducer with metallopeptidase domain|nr:hypothetical protein [Anaerocolumna sp.]
MNFIEMTLSASVMIMVITVIRTVWMNKLPKKVFLILWLIVLIRLLIPINISSPLSIYTIFSSTRETAEQYIFQPESINSKAESNNSIDISKVQTAYYPSELIAGTETGKMNVLLIIWGMGLLILSIYFCVNYFRSKREFAMSLPVKQPIIEQWLKDHRIRRKVEVRQSGQTNVPLTYGIYHPVILMPGKTDWENKERLKYVLMHEFTHICSFDNGLKLLFVVALCIHWFNPLVWVMFLLFNRDIELACDEAVVRKFGEGNKSSYALTLIGMEEEKSSENLLFSNFNKNCIEERITAIMKIKKLSKLAICAAAVLVIGITTVFATSAAEKDVKLIPIPEINYTKAEYNMLEALQYKGYQEMSLIEYRMKLIQTVDKKEYMELINRIGRDEKIKNVRFTNETADFLINIVTALLNDWNGFRINSTVDGNSDSDSSGILEYTIGCKVTDGISLTVKEYNKSLNGIVGDMSNLVKNNDSSKPYNWEAIVTAIDDIKKKWSDKAIQYDITYSYQLDGKLYLSIEQVREKEKEAAVQAEAERIAK